MGLTLLGLCNGGKSIFLTDRYNLKHLKKGEKLTSSFLLPIYHVCEVAWLYFSAFVNAVNLIPFSSHPYFCLFFGAEATLEI